MKVGKLFTCLIMCLFLICSFSSIVTASGTELSPVSKSADLSKIELAKPVAQSDIQYDKNKRLSKEQIHNRFKEINSKYSLNEPFSAEDTEFIRAYAKPAGRGPVTKGTANGYFNVSKTSHNVTAAFHGTIFSTINYIHHSYGGNITSQITSGRSNCTGMELQITNTAYGLIGTSGTYVGIVYDGDITESTTNNTSYNMNRTKNYGAVYVLYTSTAAHAVIKTNDGNFDLWDDCDL